jgi:hypothetical protein
MSRLVSKVDADPKTPATVDHAEPSTLPPRPANQTSIPALLTALQSEYDAIMLESLEIKQQYKNSRWVGSASSSMELTPADKSSLARCTERMRQRG